jgi:hypothetical protein
MKQRVYFETTVVSYFRASEFNKTDVEENRKEI